MASIQQNRNTSISMDDFRSDYKFANALSNFYLRFDRFDFREEVETPRSKLKEDRHFTIEQRDVEKSFLSLKTNKSPGPDKITIILLKSCARQLSSIFHYVFNMSLKEQTVLNVWKQAVTGSQSEQT